MNNILNGYLIGVAISLIATFAIDKDPYYRTVLFSIFWHMSVLMLIGFMIRFSRERK